MLNHKPLACFYFCLPGENEEEGNLRFLVYNNNTQEIGEFPIFTKVYKMPQMDS